MIKQVTLLICLFLVNLPLFALSSEQDNEITHCYHWLDDVRNNSHRLQAKYDFAKKNNGDILNMRGGGGTNAGDGLYCAKEVTATRSYGDRVIRIDFVDDVVIQDDDTRSGHHCPGKVLSKEECDRRDADVVHYSYNVVAYVIKNTKAIKFWSANSDQLIQDLKTAPEDTDALTKLMKEEQKSLGMINIFNGQSRMDLAEVLQKPDLLNKMSNLNMILSLSGYKDYNKIPKSKLDKLTHEYLNNLLHDHDTSYGGYSTVLNQVPQLKEQILKEVNKMMKGDKGGNTLSIAVQAGLINDGVINVDSKTLSSLWKKVLEAKPETLSEVLSMAQTKANSPLQISIFKSQLLSNKNYATNYYNATAKNGLDWILKNVKPEDKNADEVVSQLLLMLTQDKTSSSRDVVSAITTLEQAKFNIVQIETNLLLKAEFVNKSDIFVTWSNNLSKDMSDANKAQFAKKYLDGILSYNSVKDIPSNFFVTYNNKANSIINDLDLFKKISLKAFTEQNDQITAGISVDKRVHLYYTFLSQLYNFFSNYNSSAVSGNDSRAHSIDILLQLSDWIQKTRPEYAYVVLQNASFFMNGGKYDQHPLEHILSQHLEKKTQIEPTLQRIFNYSLDPVLLKYVADTAIKAEAERLAPLDAETKNMQAAQQKAAQTHQKLLAAMQAEKDAQANLQSEMDRLAKRQAELTDAELALTQAKETENERFKSGQTAEAFEAIVKASSDTKARLAAKVYDENLVKQQNARLTQAQAAAAAAVQALAKAQEQDRIDTQDSDVISAQVFAHTQALSAMPEDQDPAIVQSRNILNSIFTFINSVEFENFTQSNSFKISNEEKLGWENFIHNSNYSNSGRFKADICSFKTALGSIKVSSSLEANKTAALNKLNTLTSSLCGGK